MVNQNLIGDEIRAKYARDPRIPHPGELAVSERAGAVTLRGTVDTPQQRHAAVEIAKSVRGVRDVYDELSVDPRDRWDAEIRGAALQALMSSPGVPADQIEVKVDAAWADHAGRSSTSTRAMRRSRRQLRCRAWVESRTGSRSSPRAATDRMMSAHPTFRQAAG